MKLEYIKRENGWLMLVGNVKYTNTPIVKEESIGSFTYFINDGMNEENEDFEICFYLNSNIVRWSFESGEDMYQVFEELVLVLLHNEKIVI